MTIKIYRHKIESFGDLCSRQKICFSDPRMIESRQHLFRQNFDSGRRIFFCRQNFCESRRDFLIRESVGVKEVLEFEDAGQIVGRDSDGSSGLLK